MQECILAASLLHPHVVRLRDAFGKTVGSARQYFLVYDFAGRDLNFYLRRSAKLQADQIRRIMVGTGAGLEHIHGRGMLHADIKPANILVTVQDGGEWHVVVGDVGLAVEVFSSWGVSYSK